MFGPYTPGMICRELLMSKPIHQATRWVSVFTVALGLFSAHASEPAVPPTPAAPPSPAAPAIAVAPMPVGTGWARVTSVRPLAAPSPLGAAPLLCEEPVSAPGPSTGAGAVVGALAGAVVGSQLGSGAGQALATAAGALGGAALGDRVEADARSPQAVRPCVVAGMATAGYEVVYEYAGQSYVTVMPQHPGALIQVHLTPVGTAVPLLTVPSATVAVPTTTVVRTAPYWGSSVVVGVGYPWGGGHRHPRFRHRHWRY